ncbi:LysR substrate-binding domain-containing protein [Enterovibrio makurazakiensis]|uniref:LysR substrate-binding domain-containing protein n=2 Tax=Vibrionaceae TaxID=641 RepID=A0ABT5R235_9GAMM|nr:LysR substrate-binding domain-containing protein [Enterovibrio sp. ZSDZ42]MDD1794084.1 LysR substrate-binding domain-containing protein [Enterovibrio sp. ZSDZ42]
MNKITHLNGIRAFEATARHHSFAGAAQELNVTPAAVGQQVRQLEDWLNVRLFNRATSGSSRLTLTAEGVNAFPDIHRGFELILRGLNHLIDEPAEDIITVSASPSIASKWLLTRVNQYQMQHDDIDIQVETSISIVDYAEQGIDVGIRYGLGQWEDLCAQHLMFEDVFPVCSPEFAKQHGLNETPPHLLKGIPLLHDHSVASSSGYPSWQEWSDRVDVAVPNKLHGLKINDFASVIELARRGNGLALGRSRLIEDELKSGELVCPFDVSKYQFRSRFCYFLVWKQDEVQSDMSEHIDAFRSWLLSTA